MMIITAKGKFRISLLPQETRRKVVKNKNFVYFRPYLEPENFSDDMYSFLKEAVESLRGIKRDSSQFPAKKDKGYYYVLKAKHGDIRIELNYGGRYEVCVENPPRISVETTPYVPDKEFMAEIKEVVGYLIRQTGFKIFSDMGEFVDVVKLDDVYGRD